MKVTDLSLLCGMCQEPATAWYLAWMTGQKKQDFRGYARCGGHAGHKLNAYGTSCRAATRAEAEVGMRLGLVEEMMET